MSRKSLQKGRQGEYAAISLLEKYYPEKLKRNLLQTRDAGSDIIIKSARLSVEVKRYKKGNLYSFRSEWWSQAVKAVEGKELIPLLLYRFDRSDWNCVLPLDVFLQKPIKDFNLQSLALLSANELFTEHFKTLSFYKDGSFDW